MPRKVNKNKQKKRRGRPIGTGKYPEEIRAAWRAYKQMQREAEKESKRILKALSGNEKPKKSRS